MIRFSERLQNIISKNSYIKDWRYNTAVCLLAIGMSEMGIECAITGNLDKKKDCINLCRAENLDFNRVWALLK